MDDGLAPIVSTVTNAGDLCFVLNGSIVASTATIENCGSGVYRISATQTSGTTSLSNNGFIKFNSQSARGFKITGLQIEAGSYPTSYIPTAGSTVTRVADIAYSSTDASLFNSLEGTLFLQAEALINGGSNRYLTISNGTVSTYVRISYATATGYITAQLYNGGVVQASYDYLTTQNQNNKIAVKYGTNIFQFWVNGTKVYEKTSSVTPPSSGTFNVLKFSRGDGIDWMYAKIQGLLYFPTALSDAELIDLTTL